MADKSERWIPPELAIDAAAVAHQIETFIADRVQARRRNGVVLGLSGGIDSAVVACLATRALGPEKVLALIMPERDSSPQSERDARELAAQLGIKVEVIDLTPTLEAMGVYRLLPLHYLGPRPLQSAITHFFMRRAGGTPFRAFAGQEDGSLGVPSEVVSRFRAYINSKHRVRMVNWYLRADAEGRLALGGCNRTEKLTGFFVKYGDSAADIAPVEDLYKTQVFQLGEYLGVTSAILAKAPSPDLFPGIADEDALGVDYTVLDRILWRLERQVPPDDIARELSLDIGLVEYVAGLREAARPMNEPVEVPRVPGS